MEATEYLINNVASKYSYFPGILGCRQYIENGCDVFEFLNSDNLDGAIIRGWYRFPLYMRSHYKEIHMVEMYVQNEVMLRMLNNAELPQTKTELVKLRIAVNRINSLTFLRVEDRLSWSNWVKELYWERKKVLHKWYLEYILPFLRQAIELAICYKGLQSLVWLLFTKRRTNGTEEMYLYRRTLKSREDTKSLRNRLSSPTF